MAITVGLAGITGKFGRSLAHQLLKNPDISLRGYARDPKKVPSSIASSPNVRLFQGGAYDEATIQSFVQGCDVVVCAYLGDDGLMVEGQKKLIDACEGAGVPRYIASDWCLDYTKLQLGDLFPKDPMIHVKAYLETKQVLKGVHILISGFMDPIFSPLFRIWDPEAKTLRFWGDGTEVWEATSYDNAAEFTAAVAADPSAVGIQKCRLLVSHPYHHCTYQHPLTRSADLGDRKTIKEIAESFEKVYGIKPKLESYGSLEDLKARMHALRADSPTDVFSYMSL